MIQTIGGGAYEITYDDALVKGGVASITIEIVSCAIVDTSYQFFVYDDGTTDGSGVSAGGTFAGGSEPFTTAQNGENFYIDLTTGTKTVTYTPPADFTGVLQLAFIITGCCVSNPVPEPFSITVSAASSGDGSTNMAWPITVSAPTARASVGATAWSLGTPKPIME